MKLISPTGVEVDAADSAISSLLDAGFELVRQEQPPKAAPKPQAKPRATRKAKTTTGK